MDLVESEKFLDVVEKFVGDMGLRYRLAKNTGTVTRVYIHYDNPFRSELKSLKVKVSYRQKNYARPIRDEVVKDGILTYTPRKLLQLKLIAFTGREVIRDLFDVVFLGLNYAGNFEESDVSGLVNALGEKGLEYCDYILSTQEDELIDPNVLRDNILKLWDKLGMI